MLMMIILLKKIKIKKILWIFLKNLKTILIVNLKRVFVLLLYMEFKKNNKSLTIGHEPNLYIKKRFYKKENKKNEN